MFKFIKRNHSKDEALPVEEALAEAEQTESKQDEHAIETTLSIPSDWDLTDEERYVYAFHNSQSPTLKVNQISIYSMELIENIDESIRITGLIRSTVTRPITFDKTKILLLDENEETIAQKEFDLSKLGQLPSNSARPWNFIYTKADFVKQVDELPEKWKLAFKLESKHRLDLEKSWEKALNEEAKKRLEKIVERAPTLKKDEVNFLGFNANYKDNGDLSVSVLIRNGSDKNITVQKVPLGVKDATNEEIARGSFTLDDLTVKANTSKPWTFIFPKSLVKKENPDLSRWVAYPIQKQ